MKPITTTHTFIFENVRGEESFTHPKKKCYVYTVCLFYLFICNTKLTNIFLVQKENN